MTWNAYLIPAAVLASFLVGVGIGWTGNGWRLTAEAEQAAADAALTVAASVEAARQEEQAQQKAVNQALQVQNEKLTGINRRLVADLDRLRKRPERPSDLPPAARASCEGANGPELGRQYAEFLTRFASRAAEQDAALAACYAALDTR